MHRHILPAPWLPIFGAGVAGAADAVFCDTVPSWTIRTIDDSYFRTLHLNTSCALACDVSW